jgi:hypothetical protein
MDEGASMEPGPIDAKHLSLIITKRIAIFFLVTCLISIFYLIVGSLSSFLDETQLVLLAAIRLSAYGLLSASACGILLGIALAFLGMHEARLFAFVGYVLATVLSSVFLALADTLTILSHGLG